MKLKGSIVLITGGADGLGWELTQLLIAKGASVHVLSRDAKRHAEIRSQVGDPAKLTTHQVDITDSTAIEKVIGQIDAIDVLINNAGVWIEGPVQNNTVAAIDRAMHTNTMGTIYATRAVLPQMLAKKRGMVVNISSTSGLDVRQNSSVYCASKWAVRGFTDALKLDLKDTGVVALGVYPGGMQTEFFAKSGSKRDTTGWLDPKKVAEVICFLMERDDTMMMDHVEINKIIK